MTKKQKQRHKNTNANLEGGGVPSKHLHNIFNMKNWIKFISVFSTDIIIDLLY